jgi:peptide/nickel transport system permease protein
VKGRKTGFFVVAALIAIVVLPAAFAPALTRYEPLEQDVSRRLLPPSREHFFGTDGFGRDVYARVLYGARISMYVGLLSVGSSALFGISIGVISAFYGGSLDLIIGRLTDVVLGFPYLVLAILIIVALGSSPTAVAIAIATVLVPRVTRMARASALSVMEAPFISAARIVGAGRFRVMFRHLLPNCLQGPLTQITGYFGTAIATEVVLSYLGLGVPPPYSSWGRMIQEGTRLYFETAPWLVVFPSLALVITVVGFATIGDYARNIGVRS